ncbi:MAG: DUF3489 domain-containing protein [Alphaproteobacteria bacterium]
MAKETTRITTAPKIDQVKKLIRRKQGATITSIEKVTGWQPHTIRAALSGLRKKGVTVNHDRNAKGETFYRMEV